MERVTSKLNSKLLVRNPMNRVLLLSTRAISRNFTTSRSSKTLALLKPDLAADPLAVDEIREHLKRNHLTIEQERTKQLTVVEAGQFYEEHHGRFFYDRLIGYITSGPLIAMALSHPNNAITTWRQLIGPTQPVR
jgi:nucleoside-diphosphate kinase